MCERSFTVGHSNAFLNPATETACIKTQETKLPGTRRLNHANRKKKDYLHIGLGFLFVFFFSTLVYRLPGLLGCSGCRSGVFVHTKYKEGASGVLKAFFGYGKRVNYKIFTDKRIKTCDFFKRIWRKVDTQKA